MENYLNEAFKRLSLLEDDFNLVGDSDKIDELKSFVADDVEVPEEEVIDVNADTEADLADTYDGKIILDCNCCHSRLFKDEADVVIDDESNTVNSDDICPVCNQSLGFTVIGKISEFTPAEEAEEEKPEVEEADYDKTEDDIEDEEAFPNDDIDTEDEADEIEESCLKEDSDSEEENLPDPWGKDSKKIEEDVDSDSLLKNLLKLSADYDLDESVEITADGEDLINVVKNDDGTMEIAVGAEEEKPEEKTEETFEEIVPLTDAEKDELSAVEEVPAAEESTEPAEEVMVEPIEVAEEPAEEEPESDAEEINDVPAESEEEPTDEEKAANESLTEAGTPIQMSKALKKAVEELADDTMKEIMADNMGFAVEFVNNIWDPENGIETADQFYDLVDDLDYDSDDTALMNQVFEYAANYIHDKYSDIGGDEDDLDFDDFDEDRFDDMAESFLRKTYSNVKGYSTKTISETKDSLIIEGVINYTNGKSRNTKFIFTEARVTKRGKLILEGYNNTFSNSGRAFILSGKFTDKIFVGESLIYNYSVKKLNESTNKNEVLRVSGRIKYSK